MRVFTRKCMYGLLGAGLTISSAGNAAAPGTLANKPLWMGASVKHNVILALDDSGSMQWEMIFPADQGRLQLNTSTGSFFSTTADFGFDYNNSGDDFNVISPWLGGFEVPPIAAYGFARSPDYNGMYYNPSENYSPWPIYGTYKPTKGPFNGQTLTKFPDGNIADTSGVYRGPFNSNKEKLFETITDDFNTADKMVYDDEGNKRTSDGNVSYNWQIGTYYLKKTTGSYTYVAGASGSSSGMTTDEAVLLEAESGSYDAPMQKYSSCSGCSGDAIGTTESAGDHTSSPPSNGEIVLSFAAPGTVVKVWVRAWTPDGGSDSFWMKVDGKGDSDFSPASGDDEVWVSGYERFWQNFSAAGWQWKEWGTVSNLVEDDTYTLRIKKREDGAMVDQVLITTTADVPSGVMVLEDPTPPVITGVTRSCNPADLKAASINGLNYYDDFRLRTGKFYINDENGTPSVVSDDTPTANELGGLGPDGACLVKYVIPKTGTTFDNGVAKTRTLAEEQQNFANWFMYYRRRFYAMQGGVANSLNGVGNVRVGLFGINNQANVTMWDLDEETGQGSFLTKHYDAYNASGGTNLRSSLDFAGKQFMRTDASAPILSECQKNFTLLFSDGFNTTLNYSGVGNADGGKGKPYEDAYSGTLGDVAYKYFNTKLRTDGAYATGGAVPLSSECRDGTANAWDDCNPELHMNTYTVGFGLAGTIYEKPVAGESGASFSRRVDAHTYKDKLTWPDVTASADERQVDDMYHAAVNGFGETYSASSPTELQKKLKNALEDILDNAGSGSGVTFNSSSLSSTGDVGVYFTAFDASTWEGDLVARQLYSKEDEAKDSSKVAGSLSNKYPWRIGLATDPNKTDGAAGILDARDIAADKSPRVIYTFNGTDGVGFHWDASRDTLTASQKADLQAGESVAAGQARVAFFKGDRSNEGPTTTFKLRERASRMGDVVNSTPVFVGVPASNWPETDVFGKDADSHRAFKKAKENRTPTVWVAANDGMLHGFNAKLDAASGGGKELLAYIPGGVYNSSPTAGLSYLTNPSYTHQYYHDLSPVAQDVRINTGVTTSWRTVLVGGLGAGGKGIYALDITDPSDFTDVDSSDTNPAKVVLWEFDSGDDSDMGYLVTPPSIGMMNDGSWAVVFGNGYNSSTASTTLFILRIEKGVDGSWATAGDYTKITIPASASVDGLSSVALADLDGDRVVDRAYGGDLHGNMWAFDLSDKSPSKWGVAYKSGSGASATKVPLFKAVNADGKEQPITAAPNLAYNTETSKAGNEPNVLVGFGTGQYLTAADNTNKEVQSFYIVWDRGSTGATNSGLVRSDLVQRKLEFEKSDYDEHGKITITSDSSAAIDWNAATDLKYGWYMDFVVGTTKYGERLITKPLFRSSRDEGIVAVFITRIPGASCGGGGKSSIYALPVLTGLAPTEPIIDLDDDGKIDKDEFGVGREFGEMYDDPNMLGDTIYAACSVGEDCVDTTVTDFGDASVRTGRLGWHELIYE